MFEELYGGEEVIEESSRLRHDWYLKESSGVDYIHNNPDNISLEFLGIGMNAMLGTYDCAILLDHDTNLEDHSSAMIKSGRTKMATSFRQGDIMPSLENVFNTGWFDQECLVCPKHFSD
jgi:hypothetical protein